MYASTMGYMHYDYVDLLANVHSSVSTTLGQKKQKCALYVHCQQSYVNLFQFITMTDAPRHHSDDMV